jgi:hypothetical protein
MKEKQGKDELKHKRLAPANVNNVTHPIWGYFDNIAKLIGGIAFACWVIEEWILPRNEIFLFLTAILCVMEVFYLIFHKLLPKNHAFICIGWASYLLVMLLIYKNHTKKIEMPIISLQTGQTLDSKDPFGQVFIVSNAGPPSISNVWARCFWHYPNISSNVNFIIEAVNSSGIIKSGKSQSLHFANIDGTSPQSIVPSFKGRVFVSMEVFYTPESSTETNDTFEFCVAKDSSGNYMWMYDGEGESWESSASQTNQISPKDSVPFVDVEVREIKNVSKDYPDYPFQIVYYWTNISTWPAEHVTIQWCIIDAQSQETAWINKWPYQFYNQILWPGMTNGEARAFRDKTSPAIYNGIFSKNLRLFGALTYDDLNTNNYQVWFKIIPTNNIFETRYLSIHSQNFNWNAK